MNQHERRIRDAETDLFAELDCAGRRAISRPEAHESAGARAFARQRRTVAAPARRVDDSCVVGSLVSRTPRLPAAGGGSPRARAVGPNSLPARHVRDHTNRLIDDILDALELDDVRVVGHSLGGMFALWHVAAGSERISEVIAVGAPAVALPGVRVRMPLSPLTVRGLGVAILRAPSPAGVYHACSSRVSGPRRWRRCRTALFEALRLSARRPENARSAASLMHAIDRFRRPRSESVLTTEELDAIRVPTSIHPGIGGPLPLSAGRTCVDRPDPERDGPRDARRPRPLARRPSNGRAADRRPGTIRALGRRRKAACGRKPRPARRPLRGGRYSPWTTTYVERPPTTSARSAGCSSSFTPRASGNAAGKVAAQVELARRLVEPVPLGRRYVLGREGHVVGMVSRDP